MRKIYNPQKLRWEYEDGEPVDRPVVKRITMDERFILHWRERGLSFGEYANIPLSEVPTDYLRELKTNNPNLAEAVKRELSSR